MAFFVKRVDLGRMAATPQIDIILNKLDKFGAIQSLVIQLKFTSRGYCNCLVNPVSVHREPPRRKHSKYFITEKEVYINMRRNEYGIWIYESIYKRAK